MIINNRIIINSSEQIVLFRFDVCIIFLHKYKISDEIINEQNCIQTLHYLY